MTPTTEIKAEQKVGKLIHASKIFARNGEWHYLLLRKNSEGHFYWHEEIGGNEVETSVGAQFIEDALRLAPKQWRNESFCMVNCGFRYTLPERDEHGINALFHQMAASYASMNGIYYDDALGNNCYVQFASDEALGLWQRLKAKNRLG